MEPPLSRLTVAILHLLSTRFLLHLSLYFPFDMWIWECAVLCWNRSRLSEFITTLSLKVWIVIAWVPNFCYLFSLLQPQIESGDKSKTFFFFFSCLFPVNCCYFLYYSCLKFDCVSVKIYFSYNATISTWPSRYANTLSLSLSLGVCFTNYQSTNVGGNFTASLHIDYPMLFELRNAGIERVSHCGVLEFIAEEGMIYMPYWVSYQFPRWIVNWNTLWSWGLIVLLLWCVTRWCRICCCKKETLWKSETSLFQREPMLSYSRTPRTSWIYLIRKPCESLIYFVLLILALDSVLSCADERMKPLQLGDCFEELLMPNHWG